MEGPVKLVNKTKVYITPSALQTSQKSHIFQTVWTLVYKCIYELHNERYLEEILSEFSPQLCLAFTNQIGT